MNLRYALDSSVLSETSKQRPDLGILLWLAQVRRLVIPVGTIIEFEYGIHLAAEHDLEKALALTDWLEGLLASGMRVAETDVNVARKYGQMRACGALRPFFEAPVGSRRIKGGQDVHIAAAAIAHELVIATLNVKDFLTIHRYFPLPGLYNPKEDHWYVVPGDKRVRYRDFVAA